MQPSRFVIITGLSGSGKGTFLRALEDRGYFCVDNLPVGLIGKFHELILKAEDPSSKAAMVIDVREGQALRELPQIYEALKKEAGVDAALWFLETSDAVLVRRFSETRRPHPLDPNRPVMESIAHERELLAPVRAIADHILDTSPLTIHELRQRAASVFEDSTSSRVLVSLVSFGFKHGPPMDADLVFDVRFLPNPHFIPELKPLTGNDSGVIDFMNARPETEVFLGHLRRFMDYLLPQYEKEGKSYVTVAIGCTGGRHRSVFIANTLASHFKGRDYRVKVTHRDSEKL